MRTAIIIYMSAVLMCACRSHKEADTRIAETQQTQTAETVQKRTDSRAETRVEQTEAADSIVWTMTADSVVQTKADGTRQVLHRVLKKRTTYRPTATAKATATAQQTDTTSAVTAAQSHRQTAAQSHSESSRGGRPWWLVVIALNMASLACIIYTYRRNR